MLPCHFPLPNETTAARRSIRHCTSPSSVTAWNHEIVDLPQVLEALLVAEEVSLDESRYDRSYRELQVPLLTEDVRMDGHVLTLDCKFDR